MPWRRCGFGAIDTLWRAAYIARVRVRLNGEPRELPDGWTLARLIDDLGLSAARLAVERNREIVPRAERERVALRDGDVLELVTFVGGG
ncbi:MAG: sulfur carrier protein ThiS [Deltaproteobacteria bacterium]